jgi:3-hydroxyisobutyrate dehydrogenase
MVSLRIGFIGLGLMGVPMSRRLLQAGYSLCVWNRDQTKTAPLLQLGATSADSISALVADCDIVMLCVSNTDAVEAVVFGDGGVVNSAHKNQIIVDFSSISPQATKDFAKRLQAACGARWVDAPVSGGVVGAETGTLVIMAGGEETVIDTVRPVLAALSQRLTYMGLVGSGQATKVCNQMIVSCNLLVIAEALALAEKFGVDSAKIPAALQSGFADSIPLQLTGGRMAARELDEVKWHVKTLLKDLSLAKALGVSADSSLPMTNLACELMAQHASNGNSDRDPATLIEMYASKKT